jgi:hypothetical protein
MEKKCLWCLKREPLVTFQKKAHTIPKSLGGQNFNKNVCDTCNEFFGNRNNLNQGYSIEEALKETFNITRRKLLQVNDTKRKVGRFKSKFFEIKEKKGKQKLIIKPSFRFSSQFQSEICRAFKRGLYKMFFEELNKQKNVGYEKQYDKIRDFARFDKGDLPVFYFNRSVGVLLMLAREAETPTLFFDRMKYLYTNQTFTEIEFLGHVLGFPTTDFTNDQIQDYIYKSLQLKEKLFKNAVLIERLTDVDLALTIMDG